jgi:hypothetical protein
MNKIREKLIDLFAQNSTTEIKENSGERLKKAVGTEKYNEFIKNREFEKYFEILKKIRDDMDDAVYGVKGIQQVKECLFLLHEKKKQSREEFDMCAELIKRGIYIKSWDEEQQDYFDFGLKMIVNWRDFFISYTNRNLHETNDDFKEIIPAVLGQDFYDENKGKSNCVSHLIAHYLNKNGLEGFFDKHNMTCGDVIKDEIFQYCTSVYVFVQLVEMEIFKLQENKTNWCYLEFEKFDRWVNETGMNHYKRYQFILTDEEVFPAMLHRDYESWKSKVTERVHVTNLSELDKKQIKKRMGALAREIRDTKNQMVEDYYS